MGQRGQKVQVFSYKISQRWCRLQHGDTVTTALYIRE